MVSINKEEAKAIREKFDDVHIVRTMKQKSKRGHYFCEESRRVMAFLDELRSRCVIEKKAGVSRGTNKKSR